MSNLMLSKLTDSTTTNDNNLDKWSGMPEPASLHEVVSIPRGETPGDVEQAACTISRAGPVDP